MQYYVIVSVGYLIYYSNLLTEMSSHSGSLLLIHIMDGLGVSRIVSSGDLHVSFEVFRDNESICSFRSKSIKNTRLMVWDEKIEQVFSGDIDVKPSKDNSEIIRIALISSQSNSGNNLEAFVEHMFTSFVALEEPLAAKTSKGYRSRSPSPIRRTEKADVSPVHQGVRLERKERIFTLVSTDVNKQSTVRLRLGILFIPAEFRAMEAGVTARSLFYGAAFLTPDSSNVNDIKNSEGIPDVVGHGMGNPSAHQNEKAARKQKQLSAAIRQEFIAIVCTVDVVSDEKIESMSVVPIKTFTTLLKFHFPITYSIDIEDMVFSISDGVTPSAVTEELAIGTKPEDVLVGHNNDPMELLKLGFVDIPSKGRYFNSRIAWDYVQYCLDSNNPLLESEDPRVIDDDTVLGDPELLIERGTAVDVKRRGQKSPASVLGMTLWVEKAVTQCQNMIELLFDEVGMRPAASNVAPSLDDDIIDIVDLKLRNVAMKSISDAEVDGANSQLPPRPDTGSSEMRGRRSNSIVTKGISESHVNTNISAENLGKQSKNSSLLLPRSSSPVMRSSDSPRFSMSTSVSNLTARSADFDMDSDVTLEGVMADEKEIVLRKNMDMLRNRLLYASNILDSTMSISNLPSDLRTKCAYCLSRVIQNCSKLRDQIRTVMDRMFGSIVTASRGEIPNSSGAAGTSVSSSVDSAARFRNANTARSMSPARVSRLAEHAASKRYKLLLAVMQECQSITKKSKNLLRIMNEESFLPKEDKLFQLHPPSETASQREGDFVSSGNSLPVIYPLSGSTRESIRKFVGKVCKRSKGVFSEEVLFNDVISHLTTPLVSASAAPSLNLDGSNSVDWTRFTVTGFLNMLMHDGRGHLYPKLIHSITMEDMMAYMKEKETAEAHEGGNSIDRAVVMATMYGLVDIVAAEAYPSDASAIFKHERVFSTYFTCYLDRLHSISSGDSFNWVSGERSIHVLIQLLQHICKYSHSLADIYELVVPLLCEIYRCSESNMSTSKRLVWKGVQWRIDSQRKRSYTSSSSVYLGVVIALVVHSFVYCENTQDLQRDIGFHELQIILEWVCSVIEISNDNLKVVKETPKLISSSALSPVQVKLQYIYAREKVPQLFIPILLAACGPGRH